MKFPPPKMTDSTCTSFEIMADIPVEGAKPTLYLELPCAYTHRQQATHRIVVLFILFIKAHPHQVLNVRRIGSFPRFLDQSSRSNLKRVTLCPNRQSPARYIHLWRERFVLSLFIQACGASRSDAAYPNIFSGQISNLKPCLGAGVFLNRRRIPGSCLKIRTSHIPNLEAALRHLRHEHHPKVMWIDALC
jgi:hypothetical protein